MNRLTSAIETGQGTWSEAYGYVNGNRWVGTRSGLPGLTSETPQGSGAFNAANQIATFGYNNGNVTQTGAVAKAFSFDAEDQITQATVNGLTATYVFDGLGQRVAKTAPKSGGGTVTTTYVYTADGTLAAEYSSDLLPSECGVQTCFVTVDQVGSTRLVTDSAGNVTRRYDYLPYGSELNTGVGGRTAAMGYAAAGADTFEVKYAGQVRDAETGLDQMGLRMYSPEQGRFIGVDPDNAGAVAGVPDTWNGYAYVGNNPLNWTDPSGLALCATCATAASGNPVAIGIGVAIDLGALLYGIFGHGGNTGLPANSPVVNGAFDDISGLSGGWWSQCGFLYSSVCGIAPSSLFFTLGADGAVPIFRAEGTARAPRDIPSDRRASPRACTAEPLRIPLVVTCQFGCVGTSHPLPHTGRDYAALIGAAVYAPESGTVGFAGPLGSAGNAIAIRSPNANTYLFHLSRTIATAGQPVDAGGLIGYSGNTGHSTGPHLHFEQTSSGPITLNSSSRRVTVIDPYR